MLYTEFRELEDLTSYLKKHGVSDVFLYSYATPVMPPEELAASKRPSRDEDKRPFDERRLDREEEHRFYLLITARVGDTVAHFTKLVGVAPMVPYREESARMEPNRKEVTDLLEREGFDIRRGRWSDKAPEGLDPKN